MDIDSAAIHGRSWLIDTGCVLSGRLMSARLDFSPSPCLSSECLQEAGNEGEKARVRPGSEASLPSCTFFSGRNLRWNENTEGLAVREPSGHCPPGP